MKLKDDLELLKKEMGTRADQKKGKGLSQGDMAQAENVHLLH